MRYLLDTHVVIWSIVDRKKLSPLALRILQNSTNDVFVSSVSFWEISLKFSLGKLNLNGVSPEDFPDLVAKSQFGTIDLEVSDAATYHKLITNYHRDPFDRMLIWQAINNDLILVSQDESMSAYVSDGLKLLW